MNTIINIFKKCISILERTVLHPQYIAKRYSVCRYKIASKWAGGLVADIGCGRQELRKYLVRSNDYIGLDYPLTNKRYDLCPDIYASAENLPFPDSSIDTAIFLEVAEHLPDVRTVVMEISRTLKSGGYLIFSMPFLYPIHDAPHDFTRYTEYGLLGLFESQSLVVQDLVSLGSPIESAVLQVNLVLAWYTLNSRFAFRPVFFFLVLVVCPVLNSLVYVFRNIFSGKIKNSPFPIGYTVVLKKP